MSDTVVISLRGDQNAAKIAEFLDASQLEYSEEAFGYAFKNHRKVVALMAIGIAVRKIAPLLKGKWEDAAVVVVSPDQRFAIPVLGGHHGANELAKKLGEMGMIPVITTATEALGKDSVEVLASNRSLEILNKESTKEVNAAILQSTIPLYAINGPSIVVAGPGVALLVRKGEYVVGIGCRKGISKQEVIDAVHKGLQEADISLEEVMVYATTEKKLNEQGLVQGLQELGGNLVFVDDATINSQPVEPSRATAIGLAGVSEPSALAISKSHQLIMERRVYGNVTIAIAK